MTLKMINQRNKILKSNKKIRFKMKTKKIINVKKRFAKPNKNSLKIRTTTKKTNKKMTTSNQILRWS